MSLFRLEALEHRQKAWLGEITLARPISFAWMAACALAIAVAVVAYLCWGEYTRKARVSGFLAPREGLIRVLADPGGTVLSRKVRQGDLVHAGDALFVVTYEKSTAAAGDTRALVSRNLERRRASLLEDLARQRMLGREDAASLALRVAALRDEVAHLEQELRTQADRMQIAQAGTERYRSLRAQGFVSEMQLQQKSDELLDQRSRHQALERARLASTRDLAAAEAQLRELPIKSASDISAIERNIAAVEQELTENEARRELVVTAPQDGVVAALAVQPGETTSASVPLAALVPAGSPLEAQLFAPTSAIGFVKPGQPVLLRYAAYPYQKFGHHRGTVTSVTRTALQPGELPAQLQAREPLYRITVPLARQEVTAYGRAEPLQAGMQLEADIEIDSRRLIEWVFEPVISLRGRA